MVASPMRGLGWGRGMAERARSLENVSEENREGTSLVAQWLRIHLPMQGTRV